MSACLTNIQCATALTLIFIPPRKLRLCDFLISFKKLFRLIKNENVSQKSRMDTDLIKTRMKDIALTEFKNYTLPKSIFSDDELKVIKCLQDDDTIYLIKPDKGNGVVIINRVDYKARMQGILRDNTKFDLVNNTALKETLSKETKITNLLKELKPDEVISEHQFDELEPIGSRPGILYGLPKVHKLNFPFRPIISSIGTHCYEVAKFFIPLLRPFSTNPLTITDTFSFVKEILNLPFNTNNVVMASFDIKSLFTNIPLDETIEIIVNKCFYNTSRFHGFTVQQFTNLLTMTVKNCHFLFDGKLYHQKDGVAMGSPLGPLFANIFLSFHECTWLADCPHTFKPMFCKRYVDDCFLIFQCKEQVTLFLDHLNSKHPNIQFTHELENNGSLPFLDINITRTNGHFSTSVFHKPTSTGLYQL